jgi:hypothetical protein
MENKKTKQKLFLFVFIFTRKKLLQKNKDNEVHLDVFVASLLGKPHVLPSSKEADKREKKLFECSLIFNFIMPTSTLSRTFFFFRGKTILDQTFYVFDKVVTCLFFENFD